MIRIAAAALLIGYLPGALIFRVPIASRERRAALDAEERVFWHLVLSLAWSLSIVIALAAANRYRFDRLLIADAGVVLAVAAIGRGRLAYGGRARRLTGTCLVPILLAALGAWQFFPPSEYVIGGKDPGVYVNEGVEIAQRGSLAMREPVVAAVPAFARSLFFPPSHTDTYYSNRFMGVFLQDPATGTSMGQFPHLYPASIAVGYGLDGLTGVRMAVGAWAMLGLLAVYFFGVRAVGRPAACAASTLLGVNVISVWFGRSPGIEPVQQALVFATVLAFSRAESDDDRFFAPVAAVLLGLLLFLRIDAVMIVAACLAAAVLLWVVNRRRPAAGFVLPLAAIGALAFVYWHGPMRASSELPQIYLSNLPLAGVVAAGAGAIASLASLAWIARRNLAGARRAVPVAIIAATLAGAVYAYWFRRPGGPLTDYDAFAFRTFADLDLSRLAMVLAIVGWVAIVLRRFWRDPAFVLTVAGFSGFLFYKIHVVPLHFWMDRRFVPVILPTALLAAAAAVLGPPGIDPRRLRRLAAGRRRWQIARVAIGLVLLAAIGRGYVVQAAPLASYVEYAGVIPKLEQLASIIGERDLVIVESRDAGSDMHVLALPLAEIYAKQVLVLNSARPDKGVLAAFLEDAATRYARVLFIGGGGTDLLSRHVCAAPLSNGSIRVNEYDETPWNRLPSGVTRKDFDYSVYQIGAGACLASGFSLDVGYQDDLNVVRFYAKESTDGRTIRWTGPQSFIAIPGMTGRETEVVLVMHDGGRPRAAPPARVTVYFVTGAMQTLLGTIDVGSGFAPYQLSLPAAAVQAAARSDDPAELRLVSTVWSPRAFLGANDDRTLGVMLDRVEVH